MGKVLRDRLPRKGQGSWTVRARRDDLLENLLEAVVGRRSDLLPIRWGRMAGSAFDFFRGATSLMAGDIGPRRTTGLEVQVCGDAHLLYRQYPDEHLYGTLGLFSPHTHRLSRARAKA